MGRTALGLALLAGLLFTGNGLLGPPANAQTGPSVTISPSTSRADHADGRFSVRVELSDLNHHGTIGYHDDPDGIADRFEPSDGLGAYELYFYYDPRVVRVVGWDAGEFLRRRGTPTCLQRAVEPGLYVMGCVSMGTGAGPQGSGRLGTIHLEPVANGATDLEIETELAGPLGDALPTILTRGRAEVRNAPTDAVPRDPNSPHPGDGSNNNSNPNNPNNSNSPNNSNGNGNGNGSGANSDVEGTSVVGGPDAQGNAAGETQGPGGANGFGAAGTGYAPPNPFWQRLGLLLASASVGIALIVVGAALKPSWRRIS